MYEILRDSRVTINEHGNVPPFANNLRLYEATGAGAALVTDWKANLHEMFEPEKEVVSYRTTEECIAKVEDLLGHEERRAAIAAAGHQRTLRDHTYRQRMEDFARLVDTLKGSPATPAAAARPETRLGGA